MPASNSLIEEKATLRGTARAARQQVSPHEQKAAGVVLAITGLSFLNLKTPRIISGFYPTRDEIDCLPLLATLQGEGHTLALPVIKAKGEPLLFRKWQSGAPVEPGTFKVPVPPPSCEEVEPDIFLVPLLAYDRSGYRLGYGGGFYDRTLAKARTKRSIMTIGLAYDTQEVPNVPRETYDERLDWVLTPSGPIDCKG